LELDLQQLEMSLHPETLFLVSPWVAFHRCSLELTNGGRQCWVSTVVRLSSTNECDMKTIVTPTFYKNKFFFVQIGVHIKMHIKL
jgi:hypothetical protein